MRLTRRRLLQGAGVASGIGVAGYAASEVTGSGPSADWGRQRDPQAYADYDVRRVSAGGGAGGSADYSSIQAAVDDANPRDLILVEPGVYREAVAVEDTDRLTIRGTRRDEVVLDGEFERANGILVTADDVVVENLTVRRYTTNGVYWTGDPTEYGAEGDVSGYRASHVVAYNNRIYGIYAFRGRHGRFEHCYVSGSDDAGFYIGGAQPADAVIENCVAENNAQGFSGTNAGGNLVLRNSIWRHNTAGITPNTLDSQRGAPQGHVAGGVRIEGNEIYGNNNLDAPAGPLAHPLYGNGISITGGTNNDVVDNEIRDQAKYGVAVTPIVDDEFYRSTDNAIERNRIENSGRADLALAFPARDNAFADNEVASTRPAFLQHRDGSLGDVWVFVQMLADFLRADVSGSYPHGEVTEQPPPGEGVLAELPAMDDPEGAPPRTTIGGRLP